MADNNRTKAEAMMILKLLALTFSKPLEQLNSFPDWSTCVHVDMQSETHWPDAERELMPMLNNLAGYLVYREPTDICIVRLNGCFCICVRYI